MSYDIIFGLLVNFKRKLKRFYYKTCSKASLGLKLMLPKAIFKAFNLFPKALDKTTAIHP
jgi:hypothetical protein